MLFKSYTWIAYHAARCLCVVMCLWFLSDHRETAGVKVRVEIGPKEAASGSAVIARAGLPGTVAQKDTINLAVQLVREVKKALQEVRGICTWKNSSCAAGVLSCCW